MNAGNIPIVKQLVLLGGGHAHVEVLRNFAVRTEPGLQLVLVTRDIHTPYSGMLPGLIAGHYEFDEAHIDLRPLARLAGAQVIHAPVNGMDLDARLLHLSDRPPIRYDVLSINAGARPRMASVPGAAEHAIPVKPIDGLLERWNEIRERVKARRGSSAFRIAVVGGGAGGVELLLSLQTALESPAVEYTLVTASAEILPTHASGVRRRYRTVLADREITVISNTRVISVNKRKLRCDDDSSLAYDALFWVTDAAPPAWIRESGLATDEAGFLAVNRFLQSTSHPEIFAAGDCAAMLESPRPKSGVFAVRQGPPLADNLRAAVRLETLEAYSPQRRFLSLISTGDQNAVASWGPLAAQGEWVWRWKDRIDRTWMEKYQDVDRILKMRSKMRPPQARPEPRCGGCGAKIGSKVLRKVLHKLGIEGTDDAALVPVDGRKQLLQTVDFFREFVGDPYRFGRIAAHHAINDVLAMRARPDSALVTVVVPHGKDSFIEHTLIQLLSGVKDVLQEHGAALIGGHSAEGAELSIGLTVNGSLVAQKAWSKKGIREGDHLILTKPLGTGVLFAADMQGRAQGRWISAALDCMDQSNARAVDILGNARASACTDVTGFGFLLHLQEMLGDSLSANVHVENVPRLPGVDQLLATGLASTMAPKNAAATEDIPVKYAGILHDPQTAGGLLAGVSDNQIENCLRKLREAGYTDASAIGRVVPRDDSRNVKLLHSPS